MYFVCAGPAAVRICSCLLRSVFAALIGQWEVLRDRGVADQDKLFSETKRVIEYLRKVFVCMCLSVYVLQSVYVSVPCCVV